MSSGYGGEPHGGGIEQRLGAVKKALEKVEAKVDRVLDRASLIEVKLADLGAARAASDPSELEALRSKIQALPTVRQLIALVALAAILTIGGTFVVLRFALVHA